MFEFFLVLFLGILIGITGWAFFYVNNIDKTRKAVAEAQEEWHEQYSNLILALNEEIQKLEKKFIDLTKGK